MTDTIADVPAAEQEPVTPAFDEQRVAEQLVIQAREKGIELIGPDGLLTGITKRVLETALEAEMSDHLGYDKHDPVGRNHRNSRNGVRPKTVLTEIGPVKIDVPRDVDASFQPQIVEKRQRRLTGVDEIVLSLSARGLTTGGPTLCGQIARTRAKYVCLGVARSRGRPAAGVRARDGLVPPRLGETCSET